MPLTNQWPEAAQSDNTNQINKGGEKMIYIQFHLRIGLPESYAKSLGSCLIIKGGGKLWLAAPPTMVLCS